jgi:hypothetical protein
MQSRDSEIATLGLSWKILCFIYQPTCFFLYLFVESLILPTRENLLLLSYLWWSPRIVVWFFYLCFVSSFNSSNDPYNERSLWSYRSINLSLAVFDAHNHFLSLSFVSNSYMSVTSRCVAIFLRDQISKCSTTISKQQSIINMRAHNIFQNPWVREEKIASWPSIWNQHRAIAKIIIESKHRRPRQRFPTWCHDVCEKLRPHDQNFVLLYEMSRNRVLEYGTGSSSFDPMTRLNSNMLERRTISKLWQHMPQRWPTHRAP